MISIGLDIGTTTISACALDCETGRMVETATTANNSAIKTDKLYEKTQDAEKILSKALSLLQSFIYKYPDTVSVGLTGQMHGMLYVDGNGRALSPLATWQDARADQLIPDSSETYVDRLSRLTGYHCATGFGSATYFYDMMNHAVPEEAAGFCTIYDYILMHLCKRTKPITHPTSGASFGLFDVEAGCFDRVAIEKAGLDFSLFPEVSADYTENSVLGIPVSVGIGDNQSSFLGSVREPEKSIAVNIGTGGQISRWVPRYQITKMTDTRPYVDGGFIFSGSQLCGGRAYALLEKCFREIAILGGGAPPDMYTIMNDLAEKADQLPEKLTAITTFSGTRLDPLVRGSISGISVNNLTPAHLVVAVLQGGVNEMFDFYTDILPALDEKPTIMVGSGNGLRMNKPLQRMYSETFEMDLCIPAHREEASYGAALFALMCSEKFTYDAVRELIKYE